MATQAELEAALKAAREREKAQKLFNQLFARQNMLPSGDSDILPNPVEENRFGDTAAEFSEPAREAMKAYARRMMAEGRSPLERIQDAGRTGLSALGAAYGGTAGLLGDIVGGNRTQERKAARDFMLLGEVAVPELAGVPSAVSRIARSGAAIPPRQAAAQAAQNINVTPTLGMQNIGLGVVEAGLDKIPFSTGSIRKATDRAQDQMEAALERSVDKVGVPTTSAGAGEAAQTGAKTFIKDFQDKADDLFGAVDTKIGKNTFVTAPSAIGVLQDLTKYSEKYSNVARFLNTSKFQKLLKDLEVDGALNALPYEALKDLRSGIGRSMGKLDGPMSSLPDAELKRLYASLSQDMRAAATAAGDDALKAFNRANKFYSAGMKRINGALKKVTKADTPERAYNNILALTTADSPRGSTAKLQQLKVSLPKEQWSTVSSTILRKLGEARVGQRGAPDASDFAEFSPSTFLTNWNKMDKGAKTVLTSGNIPQSARRELDNLALVAQRFKEKPVSTGSAATNSLLTFIAGVPTIGAVKTSIIAGGTFLSAAAMTNATFLKAVNAATAGNFTKLSKLAQDGSAIGSEAATLLRLVGADQAKEEENN
tara:strand:+ start:1295 stop:3088 length:1794 start_codon:yes stop_codon:yes gene_type:complete